MRSVAFALAALLSVPAFAQEAELGGDILPSAGGGGGVTEQQLNDGLALKLNLDGSNSPMTGTLQLSSANTACSSTPSLTFGGDTNMGFQRSGADSLLLCLNGAVAATYNTTSNAFVNPLILPNGTGAGMGSFSFAGETGFNTGVYWISEGRAALQADGVGVLDWNTTRVELSRDLNIVTGRSVNFTAVTGGFLAGDGTTQKIYTASPFQSRRQTFVGGSALALGAGPTATNSPISGGGLVHVSASGTVAWTPNETGAADGDVFTVVNTSANTITMTTSAGILECGGGSAMGQWDSVTIAYVTDRWVCTAEKNN